MTDKQQVAQFNASMKAQKEAADADLRNRCLQMALDYHRTSGQKRGYAIDMEAIEPVATAKNKKGSKEAAVSVFYQTGVIAVKARDSDGKLVTGVRALEHPRPVSEADILKTANQFYNYISKNKI